MQMQAQRQGALMRGHRGSLNRTAKACSTRDRCALRHRLRGLRCMSWLSQVHRHRGIRGGLLSVGQLRLLQLRGLWGVVRTQMHGLQELFRHLHVLRLYLLLHWGRHGRVRLLSLGWLRLLRCGGRLRLLLLLTRDRTFRRGCRVLLLLSDMVQLHRFVLRRLLGHCAGILGLGVEQGQL